MDVKINLSADDLKRAVMKDVKEQYGIDINFNDIEIGCSDCSSGNILVNGRVRSNAKVRSNKDKNENTN